MVFLCRDGGRLMLVKNIVDEDFLNYKKPSMFIGCSSCTFKCDKECGKPVCQNGALASAPNIEVPVRQLVERYLQNPLTQAVVFGGLEPFDDIENVVAFILLLRKHEAQFSDIISDVVIYTGYTEEETLHLFSRYVLELRMLKNVIIKYGRFMPNQPPHYDELLGVQLYSSNQYARPI